MNFDKFVSVLEGKSLVLEVDDLLDSLVGEGDRILLMCSGGPDSTFLLFFFQYLKQKYFKKNKKIDFSVFHLDHKIREDSFKEKVLLENYCKTLSVEFFHFEENVVYLSKMNRWNLEDTARKVRYDLAVKVARENGYNKLCTAHNLDDFISSFFINFLRKRHYVNFFNLRPWGSWNNFPIIRPLLFVAKKNIKKLLDLADIEYIIDYTNFDQKLLRNSINLNITEIIVDYLKKWNIKDIAYPIFDFSKKYVENVKCFIKVEDLRQKVYKLSFKKEISQFFILESLFFNLKDILEEVSYKSVEKVFKNDIVSIKRNWFLQKESDSFFLFYYPYVMDFDIFYKEVDEDEGMITIDFKIFYKITLLKLDTDVDNLFNNLKVKMKENKNYSAFIFFDKLKLRNWKKGDYFLPYGLKGKKQKLKKFFIDRKFRRFEKERTMVFEDSEGICFVWCYQNSIKRGREFIREFKKKSRMYLAQLEVI